MITNMRHRREAKRLIQMRDRKAVEVALSYGQKFDDLKDLGWFRSAVALELYHEERRERENQHH